MGSDGTGLQWKMLVLAMVFAILSEGSDGKITQRQKLLEVDRKLKQLNKPPIKSIQSEDGDIIDCVDMYKQPAFDHPALKNHTIQMRPSNDQTKTITTHNDDKSSMTTLSQLWQRNGSCPKGTVPIRRIRKRDLLRASSLENYGRKNPYIAHAPNSTQDTKTFVHINDTGASYVRRVNRSAAYLLTQGYNYIGAKGDINIWNPPVESWDEHTTAQIWLKNGPYDLESIESGWVVNPSLYGDKRTRFFTYWTVDSSVKTGCFDLVCSGFVQINQEIALGATIYPISSRRGPQYQISLYIYQDIDTGNWWLQFGNKINVGYWPAGLFSLLSHSAIMVEWGGEVYSSKVGKSPHTATGMGSGESAWGLYGIASYIRNIRIRDYSLAIKYPEAVFPLGDEYDCYNVYNYRSSYLAEPEFYFGGPGRNFRCP